MDGRVIYGYEPDSLFKYFEEISAIPRGSYNESAIADYLCSFAEKRGLEFYRDDINNVLISCPATPGCQSQAPILLQGHTDMVCESDSGCTHDFMQDGLNLYTEGGFLRAKGTTLGADNGIAVAAMLAVLDGTAKEHAPVECLFTVREEVGLEGAVAFDYTKIKALRMINLDAEEEGEVIVSCSGGRRTSIMLNFEPVPFSGKAIHIKIGGLAGGHSGMDIHLRRANANKLIARILNDISKKTKINIISINGGSKDNAIPRECSAVITADDVYAAETEALSAADLIVKELKSADKGFKISVEPAPDTELMLNSSDSQRLIKLLNIIPDGVFEMSAELQGLTETSSNMGVVKTEGSRVLIKCSSRSSVETKLDYLIDILDCAAALCGCETFHDGSYPGWAYDEASGLRDKFASVYSDLFGREARFSAIHAGLECGIVKGALPQMDIIAIGPDMHNVHTPSESLDLPSCERFWKLLCMLVK